MSSNPSSRDRSGPDPLPPDFDTALTSVQSSLNRIGSSVVYFSVADSTNTIAAASAGKPGCEGVVILADAQTAGRGRFGRVWFSPPGSGLYVSILLTPGRFRDKERGTRLLTVAAGVALAEAIETASGLRVDLKWPNDLYVGRRKLGGILAESTGLGREDAVVVGYGVNVGAMSYPPELRERATSLETELGRPVDRAAVFAQSLAAMEQRYGDLEHGRFDAILAAWRSRAPGCVGARVTWTAASGPVTGVTAGIDSDGALLVRAGDRVERIVAGEVTWL